MRLRSQWLTTLGMSICASNISKHVQVCTHLLYIFELLTSANRKIVYRNLTQCYEYHKLPITNLACMYVVRYQINLTWHTMEEKKEVKFFPSSSEACEGLRPDKLLQRIYHVCQLLPCCVCWAYLLQNHQLLEPCRGVPDTAHYWIPQNLKLPALLQPSSTTMCTTAFGGRAKLITWGGVEVGPGVVSWGCVCLSVMWTSGCEQWRAVDHGAYWKESVRSGSRND